MAAAPAYFGVLPRALLRGPRGRGIQGEGRALRLLLPAVPGRLARRDLLRQRLRPAEPQVHQARLDDVPRGGPRPPLPDHARDREPEPRTLPPARRTGRRRRLRRGLGPVQRAARRRDGPVPDEGERFGMLDAQAWRAARLVVDTGIHALRWPRQRSIDFLLGAGLSDTDAIIETDRYICWPGQALTYMIGQLEIQRLRAELDARDGSALRPAGVPRCGARPRLAAAGDALARAAELGRHAGLSAGAGLPHRGAKAAAPRSRSRCPGRRGS